MTEAQGVELEKAVENVRDMVKKVGNKADKALTDICQISRSITDIGDELDGLTHQIRVASAQAALRNGVGAQKEKRRGSLAGASIKTAMAGIPEEDGSREARLRGERRAKRRTTRR